MPFLIKLIDEIFIYFPQKTALHFAVEDGNPQIVNLLVARKNIDVNIASISLLLFFNKILYYIF